MRVPAALLVTLTFVLPLLALLDYWSGPEFGFSLFYLVPVGIAAWRTAGSGAIVIAVLSAGCWLAADSAYHGLTLVSAWNGLTRLTLYVALAVLTRRVRRSRDDLAALNRQLESLLRQEQALARTDPLTGLPNRRMLESALQAAIARNRRSGLPLAIGVFDLDHFKRLNDTAGHAVGDAALRAVAAALTPVLRTGDVAARLGGDEFSILFHDCDETAAAAAGMRVIDAIGRALEPFQSRGLGVTGGVACFDHADDDIQAMIAAADQAMYDAKGEGKGRLAIRRVPQAIAGPGGG